MKFAEKLEIIDQLQEKIKSYGKFPADVKLKIDYKFRLDWNYYSNAIEGGTLTKEETRDVMMGNIEVHKGKPFKDFMEMKGHDEVVLEILNIGKGIKRLSETRIKNIHKTIMYEDNPEERKKIGKWKTDPNYIYNYKGERFDFTPPNEVAEEMHELLNVTNACIDATKINKKNPPHPAHIAFQFHNKYVRIHPFYDGNGRTARICTNLILISYGYPPIIIKESDKDRYNQILADIQGYGAAEGLFYNFLADRLIDSLNLVILALEGKDIEEPDDLEKEIEILKRKQNPPVVKIKKSNPEILKVLELDYFKLLIESQKRLIKFSPLFKETVWCFFEEQGKDGKVAVSPSTWNFESILSYFKSHAKSKGNSVHQFKIMFWLADYKDQHKFSAEVSFRIYFSEYQYKIEIFVGEPMASSRMVGLITKLMKSISKQMGDEYPESPLDEFMTYTLDEMGYGTHFSDKRIKMEADKVAKILLDFIKLRTDSNSA